MIRVNVDGVSATVTEKEVLTAGRVGLECAFTFTGEWDGLFKTAVFQGVESVDVALPDNTCVVPWEAMQVEGVQLKIGVFGANGAGTIVIPTIWANAGKIQPSAVGSGTEPSEPSQNANAYAVETAEEAKNIALSVQQRADNGEFDGEPGAPGADGVDGSTLWTTTVEPAEPIGGGYEFMVSDLTGVSGGTPAAGDIIFYGSAYYPITSVTGHSVLDRKAIADTRTSIRGATGPAATGQQVQTAVDAWLEEHPEEIEEQVQDAVDEYLTNHPTATGTFTNEAKNALLTLLEKVAYTVSDGQTYLDALRTELFRINVDSISAVFTQGTAVIYDTDSLDTLKQYLVVTATYSDSTTEVLPDSVYALSGTLTAGTSTITVTYGGETATFDVAVSDMMLNNILTLDGIQNTRSGHNASATTWEDLSGNENDFSQHSGASAVIWSTDHAVFDATRRTLSLSKNIVSGISSAFTVELVLNITGKGSTQVSGVNYGAIFSSGSSASETTSAGLRFATYNTSGISTFCNGGGLGYTGSIAATPTYIAYCVSGGTCSRYVNGVLAGTTNNVTIPTALSLATIGGFPNDWYYNGYIYRIGLSSSALTAEEVASRYQFYKTRFSM